MAITPQILANVRPGAAAQTVIYTPTADSATISTITVHNTSTTTTDVCVMTAAPQGAVDATAHQLFNVNVPPEGTIVFTIGATLNTTDVIRATATNGTLNFHVFGILET